MGAAMTNPNTARAEQPATDLRRRAACARDAAGRFIKRSVVVEVPPASSDASEPDPALAVVALFNATWTALGEAINAEVPDDLLEDIEAAEGAAYNRLKTVRPTTPDGFRALAGAWSTVLNGERGNEPGMMASDHAADSLIAGAGAWAPVQPIDWYDPPPGFMASPALEPSSFVPFADGIAHELARLRGAAWAELRRRAGPGTKAEDIRRIRRELHLDTLSPSVPKSDILDQVDFASADLNELRSLHDRARELSNVAYAMSAMGCCENKAAGRLLHWLADELTTVEGKAAAEMRSRQPTGFWDQRARLGMIAESIIENGDTTETATFIQELATWAAEQAER